VSDSGVLYTWGRGQNGRLGHGNNETELSPKPVEALMGQYVVQVGCGEYHTACVTNNPSHVYTWGLGLSGRLGHGDEQDRLVPTCVETLGGHVVSLACGGHHSAAISERWQLCTWGGGAFGKLGHGNRLAKTKPTKVQVSAKLVQVSLGVHHSMALSNQGEVFTWGQAGRLGHASQGAEVDEMFPRQILALSGVFVVQISAGHAHCACVTETGDVWAWGANRAYGHTDPACVPNTPTMLKALGGKAIVQVACGTSHSIVLSDYRRLSGKAALAAARSLGSAREEEEVELPEDGAPGQLARPIVPPAAEPGPPSVPPMATLLPSPSVEREMAFLSKELKYYQDQARLLARQLRDTGGRLHTLQSENQFLKSELELMHQCSNDADERLDALRRHFQDRIREMERRYAEREARWKTTFQRLRSHLDVAPPTDADTSFPPDEPADDVPR
jgi:hypothetical protein